MIDPTHPIVVKNNSKLIHPLARFPALSLNSSEIPILSMRDVSNITAAKLRATYEHLGGNVTSELQSVKNVSTEESSNIQKLKNSTQKPISEPDDMLHSTYNGGQDVDELKSGKELSGEEKKILEKEKKPSEGNEKKASEKDEKKSKTPVNDKGKDPKSEFDLSSKFNKNGPKLMNETKMKSGESVLESTSKMMVVSSSVLSSTKMHTPSERIDPAPIISVLLSAAFILGAGVVGLLVWKKISM